MKSQSMKMLELLNVKQTKLGEEMVKETYDLSKLDNSAGQKLANVFTNARTKGNTSDDEESQELAKNISVAMEMVTHASVAGYSIDVTPLKFATFNAQSTGLITASIRATSVADTRGGRQAGIVTRDGGDKTKAVPQVAVSVTGLTSAGVMALDKLAKIARLATNKLMFKSYARMGAGGKKAYLNNLKYRKAKEEIYQGRFRGEMDDLAARQSDLREIVSYIEVGEKSADFSMAGFYSTMSLDATSYFGNVFENDADLKHIKEDSIDGVTTVYSRTIPDLMNPAKANYHEAFSELAKEYSEALQILQIGVLTLVAYSEIEYLNLGTPKFNEKEAMDILDSILNDLTNDPETSMVHLEETLDISEEEKIDVIAEISPAIKDINNRRTLEKMADLD